MERMSLEKRGQVKACVPKYSTLQVTRTMGMAACMFWSTHPEGCGQLGQKDEDGGQVATVGTLAERWAARKGGERRWTAERFRRENCQGCCSRQNSVSKDAHVLIPKHATPMLHGRRELRLQMKGCSSADSERGR